MDISPTVHASIVHYRTGPGRICGPGKLQPYLNPFTMKTVVTLLLFLVCFTMAVSCTPPEDLAEETPHTQDVMATGDDVSTPPDNEKDR